MHPKKERTFVILKPDTIQRSLIGEIIKRFERVGYKLCATKLVLPTEDQCWKHYNKDDAWFIKKGTAIIDVKKSKGLPIEKEAIEYGKDIIRGAVNYMICGPVLCMVWEGNQAVAVIKKLVGGTEPLTSDVGTIRGDYSLDSYFLSETDVRGSVRNLVHCTDEVSEYEREVGIWFKPEEIIDYRLIQEEILYDVNLDGILE
ncbi:MAG: nucleoside-diphosphate kinase [Candidatus Doudnabacteria bacterium Gr01-1014_77]|uniref:nucleoside-diphosphate kinase n=1 Tax=Candidatus Doudnabacteria bacterium Gr01-1014_77 TaxID=2017133 RepID=A0A554JBB0_9BACT|nr:MAG: nucleoside-diphosphate kinase [Candidatus Doudnabacteria bacterium Gr01-1014_77]